MSNDPKVRATASQMAKSISKTGLRIIKDAVKQRELLVEEEEYIRKIQICTDCQHYTKHHRCALCGCFMPIKAKFKVGYCPIRKYEKQDLQ
jgi:hypothetical protein